MSNFQKFIDDISLRFLPNSNLIDFFELIQSTNFSLFDFSSIIIDNLDFNRNLIFRNQLFEIYLIQWKKNYSTNYHSHPNNGCILKVLNGKLIETIKPNLTSDIKQSIIRNMNDTSYIDNKIGIHKVEALEDSLSIHIYSPPLFFE